MPALAASRHASRAGSGCTPPRRDASRGKSLPVSPMYRPSRSVAGNVSAKRAGVPLQRRVAQTVVRAQAAPTPPPGAEAPPETPPLSLECRKTELADGVTQLTVMCKERFAYEVEYSLNRGTMENTFLIKGPEKTVLYGVPDDRFSEAFMEMLTSTVDPTSITDVVLPNFGPKRVKALVEILSLRPEGAGSLQILCGNAALGFLREALPEDTKEGTDYQLTPVRGGATLKLGTVNFVNTQTLNFVLTPTPRWPDLFCAYHPSSETLFTGKLFSSHVSTQEVFDTKEWSSLKEDWYHFFQCTLSASAKQSKNALTKLQGYQMGNAETSASKALTVKQIAPMHGVVVRSHISELMKEYKAWTQEQIQAAETASVAVIYASAYGNTTALAQAIARGISKAGVGVESINCELSGTDEVNDLLARNNGFALGSPTLGGHMPTPVQEALGAILQSSDAKKQPCGVFGSFGWSGEAIDMMHGALKDSGFSFAFDPIRCKFKPTLEMLQICEESGTDLAQAVLKEKRKKDLAARKVTSLDTSSTQKAVGRLVGSLCVVTTALEDASSAMVASWVSQASFNPPGITVAVAKDRAAESLMLVGTPFALSVLADGRSKDAMKQLLKPFKPGEDRFNNYETIEGANTGLAVLPESAAYLECEIKSKMDVGDHWILYAEVNSGQVLDENAITALHHRKAGTHY